MHSSLRNIFVYSSRRNSSEISGRKVDSLVSVMGLDWQHSAKRLAREIAAWGKKMVHLWCARFYDTPHFYPCVSSSLVSLTLSSPLQKRKLISYKSVSKDNLLAQCISTAYVRLLWEFECDWMHVQRHFVMINMVQYECVCAWWEIDIWRSVYSLRIKDAPSVREIEKNKAPLAAWQLH